MSARAYLEFAAVGEYMRVAAVCADTGLEVSVIGPASAARVDLERLALAKLEWARKRRAGEGAAPQPPATSGQGTRIRPGKLV